MLSCRIEGSYFCSRLYDVTFQKTVSFAVSAAKASSLTCYVTSLVHDESYRNGVKYGLNAVGTFLRHYALLWWEDHCQLFSMKVRETEQCI